MLFVGTPEWWNKYCPINCKKLACKNFCPTLKMCLGHQIIYCASYLPNDNGDGGGGRGN